MRARRRAGGLEDAVLDVLWAAGEPLVAAQVMDALTSVGSAPAYTTVTTTLARLHVKGLLGRQPHGRGYAYAPTVQAADSAARRMHELLSSGPGRDVVLSRFVSGLSDDDEAALVELLRRSGDRPTATD